MSDDRAAAIRLQMRAIRSELRDDATALVENARLTFDWKHYVRQHPWWCVGAAAVVGYFIVPRSKPKVALDSGALDHLAKQLQSTAQPAEPVKKASFLMATVMPFLLKAAFNAAVSYVQSGGFSARHPQPEEDKDLARPIRPR